MNKDLIFRKGVSTLVETILEAADESPISNYINNTQTLWHSIKNKELFYQQGVQLCTNGEIPKINA